MCGKILIGKIKELLFLNHCFRREKWLQYFVDGGELVSYTIHAIFIGFGALFYYNVEVSSYNNVSQAKF